MTELWPLLHPPLLLRLPISQRTIPETLEQEIDRLDRDEDREQANMHELRTFGYSHLIPLGRLNTQEEDQESSFASPSPPHHSSPPAMEQDERLTATEQLRANGQAQEGGAGENERDLDADIEDGDGSGSGSGSGGSQMSGEDADERDLDASIEDLDASEEESIRME